MSMNAPHFPNIAALDYPPHLKKKITAAEKAFELWAEADTAQVEAEHEREAAEAKFRADLQVAARDSKGIPQRPDYEALDNAISYAAEVAKARHQEASTLISELKLAFQENRAVIFELSVAKAHKGIAAYRAAVAAVAEALDQAEQDRLAAYDGLVMSADYSRPEVLFDPNFMNDSTIQLPYTHENRAHSAIGSLSDLLANLKRSEPGAAA